MKQLREIVREPQIYEETLNFSLEIQSEFWSFWQFVIFMQKTKCPCNVGRSLWPQYFSILENCTKQSIMKKMLLKTSSFTKKRNKKTSIYC
jgi:hypothetical protein